MKTISDFINDLSNDDIDLYNKLDNLCGHGQISDKAYKWASLTKNFELIEDYIREILQDEVGNSDLSIRCNYFIVDETERLYEQGLIEKDDWTGGLYNCDDLYLYAIADVLGVGMDDLETYDRAINHTEPRQIDITKQDVRCCDELMLEDDYINATYELWFDHFEYFGVKEPYDAEELSYVNFYTDWYPDGTIKACYTVYSDKGFEYEDDWELTDEEKEFFINKMEEYCQQCDGISLMELWNEYNE